MLLYSTSFLSKKIFVGHAELYRKIITSFVLCDTCFGHTVYILCTMFTTTCTHSQIALSQLHHCQILTSIIDPDLWPSSQLYPARIVGSWNDMYNMQVMHQLGNLLQFPHRKETNNNIVRYIHLLTIMITMINNQSQTDDETASSHWTLTSIDNYSIPWKQEV